MTSESEETHIKVGPCGAIKGNVQWDDGYHDAIRQICVYYSEKNVNCIQAAYVDHFKIRSTVLYPKHGTDRSSDFFEEITISPDDPIFSVSGIYQCDNLQELTSLKFVTASGITYGPYGIDASVRTKNLSYGYGYGTLEFARDEREENSFCFKTGSGVRGFHGSTNGSNLCSIGIYVQSQAS